MESIMARITLAVGFRDERTLSHLATLNPQIAFSFRAPVTVHPHTASGVSQVV
jgi:hypothetical protein